MRLLLDTHLLLWAAGTPKRLSATTRKAIESPDNKLFFSVASITLSRAYPQGMR